MTVLRISTNFNSCKGVLFSPYFFCWTAKSKSSLHDNDNWDDRIYAISLIWKFVLFSHLLLMLLHWLISGQSKHSPSLSTNKIQPSSWRERGLCQVGMTSPLFLFWFYLLLIYLASLGWFYLVCHLLKFMSRGYMDSNNNLITIYILFSFLLETETVYGNQNKFNKAYRSSG